MQSQGLVEVLNPSEVFLEERLDGATGSAIVVTMEGTPYPCGSAGSGDPEHVWQCQADHDRLGLQPCQLDYGGFGKTGRPAPPKPRCLP